MRSYGCGVAVGVSVDVAVIDAKGVSALVAVIAGDAASVGSTVGAGGSTPSGVGVACTRNVSAVALMNGYMLAAGTFTCHVESDEITG